MGKGEGEGRREASARFAPQSGTKLDIDKNNFKFLSTMSNSGEANDVDKLNMSLTVITSHWKTLKFEGTLLL